MLGRIGSERSVEQAEQLLRFDDTLPTLAADLDTILDEIKAVGEDTRIAGEQ